MAQTFAFMTLILAETFHVFNVRDNDKSIFKTGDFGNKYVGIAAILNVILLGFILFIPSICDIFNLSHIPFDKIPILVFLSIIPIIVVEIFKFFGINKVEKE